MRAPERPQDPDLLRLLAEGDLRVRGRLPWSSNATFLAEAVLADRSAPVVYKPARGERPLWDYPPGLYRREMAVWLVSEALGWRLVPETLIREGPLGPGAVQRFVPAQVDEHYFTLLERPEHHDALKAICVLDLVVNNGDRKSGHCLLGEDGRIWAIDHGLCLHDQPKLRTVMWDFAGQPVPAPLVDDVGRLAGSPPPELSGLLSTDELASLVHRAHALADRPVFPAARSARAFPWPLV